MKRSIRSFFLIVSLSSLSIACDKDEPAVTQPVIYRNGALHCKDCDDFGRLLSMEGPHLLVADRSRVFWLTAAGSDWELKQLIEPGFEVAALKVQDHTLCIGDGVQRVLVYELHTGRWEESQELQVDIRTNHFGTTIDMDGDKLLIGARGNVSGWPPVVEIGSIHFYQQEEGRWVPAGSFRQEGASDVGFFGRVIGLQGNYAYVGSYLLDGLYVYTFDDGQWRFKERWEDPRIGVAHSIATDGDRILVAGGNFMDDPLHLFEVQNGRPLREYPIDYDPGDGFNADTPVQLHGAYALIAMDRTEAGLNNQVLLLHLENDRWRVQDRYPSQASGSARFGRSLGLTDQWIAVGDDGADGGKVYLYPK